MATRPGFRTSRCITCISRRALTLCRHAKNGFDVTKGGFEYNIALMCIAGALLIAGPGIFSAHEGIERLVEGRGAKKFLRRAKPPPALRLIKLLK